MSLNECAHRARDPHHDENRDHDRAHHDREVLDEPDRREHRIEREHDVDEGDLQYEHDEPTSDASTAAGVTSLEHVVNLDDALAKQKEATQEKDEITPR